MAEPIDFKARGGKMQPLNLSPRGMETRNTTAMQSQSQLRPSVLDQVDLGALELDPVSQNYNTDKQPRSDANKRDEDLIDEFDLL